MKLTTKEKVEVAAAPVPLELNLAQQGQFSAWGYLRVDIRNLSVTVNHHFEYQ